MSKFAYTAFVAFVSSILTLVAVHLLAPAPGAQVDASDELPRITMAELAQHDHPESCWKAIHGYVYDVTEYIPDHPTPPHVMHRWCGRESTSAWEDKGRGRGAHSRAAELMLEPYLVGILVED